MTETTTPTPKRLPGCAFLIGSTATIAFYLIVHLEPFADSMLRRYTAGHPINYAETAAFFWGMADLLLRLLDFRRQRAALGFAWLNPAAEPQPAVSANRLLEQLRAAPRKWRNTLIARRLHAILVFVKERRSADGIDDHVRYLADGDSDAAHSSFALVRILAWMIPILGFLGTVIGITIAIANVTPDQLESSLPNVTGGLAIAFDTTAQALALSLVLIVAQSLVERKTQHLLNDVDQKAELLLGHRFLAGNSDLAPFLAALRIASETMIGHSNQLVENQAESWRQIVATCQGQAEAFFEQQRKNWSEITQASRILGEAHRESFAQITMQLKSVEQVLQAVANRLTHLLDANGQLSLLEGRLVENLSAIEHTQRLDDALHSLSAAIHLLTARHRPIPEDGRKVA